MQAWVRSIPWPAIVAAQMMLDYLGENEAAVRLLGAIRDVVQDKLISLDAGKMGYSTAEVGDLVVSCLG